nr:hypothetical protein [Armatimonas sp.]
MTEETMPIETDPTIEKRAKEIRRVRRMIGELYSLAEHASLSGAFRKDGAMEAVRIYNDTLTVLQTHGVELQGMFAPLPSDASFDRIGVASRLLRGYLEEEDEEAFPGKVKNKGVKIMVGRHGEHSGHIAMEELGKLKDIGSVIREHLPDWLREAPPAPPTPPVPPAPPSPPISPTPPHRTDDE